ncbi:MAG TPA: class I SAM-dependent methyltransferase [Saprospiraceae bacterium]|nr:class I SAM-dependent methyltransferase [Saprospiraceae bacterium]HRX29142.1 class I SAM-dependent methyltransferase [Saprospiraceae bacterium]
MIWSRESSLFSNKNSGENWIRHENGEIEKFEIAIKSGKKTNLLRLKNDIVKNLTSKIEYYRDSRTKLYNGDTEYVGSCPISGIPTEKTSLVANIYGAEYVQTPDLGHVYVKNRPSKKSIHNFYLNDITYASTYTDKSGAEFRLNNIAIPWLDWTLEVYFQQFKAMPKRILDVGSGAGHFVEACRRRGIEAEGIELSENSRKFAKEIWGIDMDGRDFTKVSTEYSGYDIVTFWGLLEHTPNPKQILKHAFNIVSQSKNGGMVISKLPRWDSLSTASQVLNPKTIIRHADPMGHIMLFSDASAAELYYQCGLKITNAWYYGMDVYETFMQLGNNTQHYEAFVNSGIFQMDLQDYIDIFKISDGLTIAGIVK